MQAWYCAADLEQHKKVTYRKVLEDVCMPSVKTPTVGLSTLLFQRYGLLVDMHRTNVLLCDRVCDFHNLQITCTFSLRVQLCKFWCLTNHLNLVIVIKTSGYNVNPQGVHIIGCILYKRKVRWFIIFCYVFSYISGTQIPYILRFETENVKF